MLICKVEIIIVPSESK